jgi:LuxR family maltose regulon positive regulatory protein
MERVEPSRRTPELPSDHSEDLIAAKLRIPEPLAPLLVRPRLGTRLSAAMDQSVVVLLVGPSGIGKTAELVQWSTGTARPLAWITIDGRDNDPQRLWRHVVAALTLATGESLRPPAGLAPGSDVYVAALADRVLELDHRPVLVLDEYEHLVSPEVHDQLDLLIRACGDRLTTVIAGRVRPPLRLERLFLSGRLSTFTWPDLRFDPQEVRSLLAEVFDVVVDPDAAAALASAVDGWAGGLMLAGAHLRAGQDATLLASRLAEGRPDVGDYLLDHVWTDLAPAMREFLLDTAVLGRFCAALADAVRGRRDSAELLDRLRRDGLFLSAEDGSGRWVRYQRLFRHALMHRLEATDPKRVRAVHRSAAAWHAAQGYREEAVDHALLGRDYTLAASLLRELYEDHYQTGRLATLAQWLSAFPDEEIGKNPWLVTRALNLWCLLGRFDERDRWSRAGAPAHRDPDPTGLDAWRLCLPREQGDLALALRQGKALLGTETSGSRRPLVPGPSRISVARTLLLAGQLAECRRLLDEVAALGAGTPPPLRATMHGIAGLAAHLAGDRAAAVTHAGRLRHALRECQVRPTPRMAPEGIVLRAVMADEDADQDGTALLEDLIAAPPGFGTDKTMRAFVLILLARGLLRRAATAQAAGHLAEADELLAECPSPLGLIDLRNEVASLIREPSHRGPRPTTVALSERETIVLQYLRSELTLREIAEDLFLSVNTVKTHARNVYRKLRVTGRQELAKPSPAAAPATTTPSGGAPGP